MDIGIPCVPPCVRVTVCDRSISPEYTSVVYYDVQSSETVLDLSCRVIDALLVRDVDFDL